MFNNVYRVHYPSPIYPAWKTILTIWQNMNARELQKSQFPSCLVNCEMFGNTKLILKSPNFQSLPWIGKNWAVQLKQHSKILIFDIFVNWGKLGSTASDQDSKDPIFNQLMNWEKLCPNLSFTDGEGWPHFKLNMSNEIFHFFKFQEFINELRKICFQLVKM